MTVKRTKSIGGSSSNSKGIGTNIRRSSFNTTNRVPPQRSVSLTPSSLSSSSSSSFVLLQNNNNHHHDLVNNNNNNMMNNSYHHHRISHRQNSNRTRCRLSSHYLYGFIGILLLLLLLLISSSSVLFLTNTNTTNTNTIAMKLTMLLMSYWEYYEHVTVPAIQQQLRKVIQRISNDNNSNNNDSIIGNNDTTKSTNHNIIDTAHDDQEQEERKTTHQIITTKEEKQVPVLSSSSSSGTTSNDIRFQQRQQVDPKVIVTTTDEKKKKIPTTVLSMEQEQAQAEAVSIANLKQQPMETLIITLSTDDNIIIENDNNNNNDNNSFDIHILLRPDWSYESVEYIRTIVEQYYPTETNNTTNAQNIKCEDYMHDSNHCNELYIIEHNGNIIEGQMGSKDDEINRALDKIMVPGQCPNQGLQSFVNNCVDAIYWNNDCGPCHGPLLELGMIAWAGGTIGPDFFINLYNKAKYVIQPWGTQHTVWGQLTNLEEINLLRTITKQQKNITYVDEYGLHTMKNPYIFTNMKIV